MPPGTMNSWPTAQVQSWEFEGSFYAEKAEAGRGKPLSEAAEPAPPHSCLSGSFPQMPRLVPSHSHSHTAPQPHPGAMRPRQLLPGSWKAWAKDRRAEPGGSRRKVPVGSFLCGPLSFLSCCHLPKVMAMWGMGNGEGRGPGRGGAEISRSLHSSGPPWTECWKPWT